MVANQFAKTCRVLRIAVKLTLLVIALALLIYYAPLINLWLSII